MMQRLQDLSIIVTGGASGIGWATVRLLVEQQARVVLADLKEQAVADCVEQIPVADRARVLGHACDVRQAADCDQLVATAVQQFGRVDALVHCAGILRPSGNRPRPLHELEEAEYEAVVDTNLKGTFLVNRAVLRTMIAQRGGQIINLSSTSGRKGRPLDAVYSASKAGVIALSESIAEEVRTFGIRVQVLMPDAVDTPLWKQNGVVATAPPQSLPAERVAELVAFCLALPPDTMIENLIIAPFRARAGRRGGPATRSESHAT